MGIVNGRGCLLDGYGRCSKSPSANSDGGGTSNVERGSRKSTQLVFNSDKQQIDFVSYFLRFSLRVSGFAPVHHFVESSPAESPGNPRKQGRGLFQLFTYEFILSRVEHGGPGGH